MNTLFPRLSANIYIEEFVKNRDRKKDGKKKIFFVLDPDKPSWVFVNEDSLEILKLCNGQNSVEKISKIISDKYQIEYNDSLEIVNSFLNKMEEDQIIYETNTINFPKNEFNCLSLELTKKCNLRCIHCYLSAGDEDDTELTLDEIKELLRSTKNSGGTSVALGGGEPLLRTDFMDIIKYANSLGLLISLGSNGTVIDEELAKSFSEIPLKIQISLDGATKETHDGVRGEGSFDLAVAGIEHLIKEGMAKDLVIAFTPMKTNLHEVPDIINFALKRQIPVIQFPPLASSGRAKENWKELRLSDDEMLWFWEFISKKSDELRGKMDLLADCFSMNINNAGIHQRCSIGTQLRVDPDGDVYPCQCFHFGSEYCLGNLRETNLTDIIYGKRIKEIKETCFQRPLNIDECKDCLWKNFCGSGCMGNAFENSGTVLKPESCEVRKIWIKKLFEIKLKQIS